MGEWVLLDREDYEDEIARLRRERDAMSAALVLAGNQLQRVRGVVKLWEPRLPTGCAAAFRAALADYET